MPAIADVFVACDRAVEQRVPLRPPDPGSAGSPFQNWFEDSLRHAGLSSHSLGANAWPDFELDDHLEGYELKGLEIPGRQKDFDANSRLPKGEHRGRDVYYVFGRYAKGAAGSRQPLQDMVVCHGSFLSRDGQLIHKNTSVRGGGSYGDILIRVRKMFVPPTPFSTVTGTSGTQTLIVPESMRHKLDADIRLKLVGKLERVEATVRITGMSLDLSQPGMTVATAPVATGGSVHAFAAYRAVGQPATPVRMSEAPATVAVLEDEE